MVFSWKYSVQVYWLTGESSIGKSEVALDLISRGHRLIADDAPEFTRVGPDLIIGKSPGVLKDFMEVRGLGVLNIREMYGDNALKASKYLRLCIHMQRLSDDQLTEIDRLEGSRRLRTILGVKVPEVLLPRCPRPQTFLLLLKPQYATIFCDKAGTMLLNNSWISSRKLLIVTKHYNGTL